MRSDNIKHNLVYSMENVCGVCTCSMFNVRYRIHLLANSNSNDDVMECMHMNMNMFKFNKIEYPVSNWF